MRLILALVVAVLVLGDSVALAQNVGRPNPWGEEPDYTYWEGLGVMAGLSLTTLGGWNADADRKMGWNAGAYAAYRFHEHARLQAELLYTNEGAVIYHRDLVDGDATILLAYLQPTLLFQGVIPVNDRLAVQPYGGLTRAMLISASFEDVVAEEVSDSISDTDIGIQFGVSIEMMVDGHGRAHADLRFDWGMNTIDDPGHAYPADVRSRAVMLLLGYSII